MATRAGPIEAAERPKDHPKVTVLITPPGITSPVFPQLITVTMMDCYILRSF
jgi:hypothetical protein